MEYKKGKSSKYFEDPQLVPSKYFEDPQNLAEILRIYPQSLGMTNPQTISDYLENYPQNIVRIFFGENSEDYLVEVSFQKCSGLPPPPKSSEYGFFSAMQFQH